MIANTLIALAALAVALSAAAERGEAQNGGGEAARSLEQRVAALEEAAEPIAVNGWFCETDLSGEDAPAAPQPHVVSAASYGGALEQARLSTPNDYTLEAVRCRPVEADARYAGADHVHEVSGSAPPSRRGACGRTAHGAPRE